MVVLHPSRSKFMSTRSFEAFWDERITGFLIEVSAAKDAILAAETFYIIFSFFSKEVSLSIRHHMIRCILFVKCMQEVHYTTCKSARNCIFGHLHSPQNVIYSFLPNNCIFHLNIVGTRQASIRNRINEKSVALGKYVVIISPKANRK